MGKSYFKGVFTIAFGVVAAIFFWQLWQRVTEVIGNGDLTFAILGGLLLIGMFLGFYNWKNIMKRFG